MAETMHNLPISQFYFHPDNPCGEIIPAEEMALSILLFGVIHP
jgi:hypothetical protein